MLLWALLRLNEIIMALNGFITVVHYLEGIE